MPLRPLFLSAPTGERARQDAAGSRRPRACARTMCVRTRVQRRHTPTGMQSRPRPSPGSGAAPICFPPARCGQAAHAARPDAALHRHQPTAAADASRTRCHPAPARLPPPRRPPSAALLSILPVSAARMASIIFTFLPPSNTTRTPSWPRLWVCRIKISRLTDWKIETVVNLQTQLAAFLGMMIGRISSKIYGQKCDQIGAHEKNNDSNLSNAKRVVFESEEGSKMSPITVLR